MTFSVGSPRTCSNCGLLRFALDPRGRCHVCAVMLAAPKPGPIEFHYGMVVGIDHQPTARIMLIGPGVNMAAFVGGTIINRFGAPTWVGIVLADESDDAWPVESLITIHPANRGIVVIEEGE